jgi:hypothetical protein
VGTLLFAVFAGALVAALFGGWRRAPVPERGVVAAGFGVTVYFFVHGQFDWLEAYPVLAGPALALPFAAAGVRAAGAGRAEAADDGEPRRARIQLGPALPVAGVLAVLLLGVLLLAPWLAIRWTDRAVNAWRTAPGPAFRDLERAADVNSASITPLLYAGVIAVERGENDRARRFFEQGLQREDHWLAHYELAGIASAGGDARTARRELALAARANVLDEAIAEAREDLRDGKRITPTLMLERLSEGPLTKIRRLS